MSTSFSPRVRGFTLIELLVVIGIIALVGTITVMGFKAVTKDAKLSSGRNAVMAALDNARALAMKNNTIVMMVFRPRWEGDKKQYVEAVTARWTRESYVNGTIVIDRFVPITDVPARALPEGIKVACPRYGEAIGAANTNMDYAWVTQVHLPAVDQQNPTGGNSEWHGALIGVMFSADGNVITRNAQSAADRAFVDFNDDFLQRERLNAGSVNDYDNLASFPVVDYFEQYFEDDEPYVTFAPFLSVYDDAAARELRTNNWSTEAGIMADLTGDPTTNTPGFISQYADRIHFNRYTGVAMK